MYFTSRIFKENVLCDNSVVRWDDENAYVDVRWKRKRKKINVVWNKSYRYPSWPQICVWQILVSLERFRYIVFVRTPWVFIGLVRLINTLFSLDSAPHTDSQLKKIKRTNRAKIIRCRQQRTDYGFALYISRDDF